MLRVALIFLAGVLLGANAMYYLLTRDARRDEVHVADKVPVADEVPARRTGTPHDATAVAPAPPVPPAVPGPTGLVVPVQGILANQLSNTFVDARSSGRVHNAIDIMAPRGTPVLAVADGRIEKLFTSKLGGLTLYQFEASGRYAYYYAHLDRYAPGVVEGKPLRRGEVIGHVGSTGNANPDGPHLHFAVFVLGPDKQWWKGTAVNPYPLLGGS